MAEIIRFLDWFEAEHDRLALLALALVAFALITAFGAALRYSLHRLSRKTVPVVERGRRVAVSRTEALDPEGPSREPRSRLQRRASIVGRRFRKSRRIKDNLLFLSSFATAPMKVGSITPSSRRLGRAMAAELPDDYEVCVELGGGTGSLTSAILAAGVPRDKLIVIERDPRLAAHLRKRFPKVKVIQGDAQHLRRLLARQGIDHVDAVISGLPLRNLPGSVRRNIATEVFTALAMGGTFVQFTYWGEPPVPEEVAFRYGVGNRMTRRVWRNMPPANVWRYERGPDLGNSSVMMD